MAINFKAGRAAVQAKRDREAAFNALPLIEQIRIVVREEVANALAERARLDQMTPAEQQFYMQSSEPRRVNER